MPVRAACLAMFLMFFAAYSRSKRTRTSPRAPWRALSPTPPDNPPAKAVVQLKNTKTLQIRSFITQADGSYHFAGLGTDVEYQVKAERDGATTSWKTLSVFNSKKTAIINLKLNK